MPPKGKGIATGGGGLSKPKNTFSNPVKQIKGAAEKLAKKIYGRPDPENTPEWRARQRMIDTKKLQNVGARVRTGKPQVPRAKTPK